MRKDTVKCGVLCRFILGIIIMVLCLVSLNIHLHNKIEKKRQSNAIIPVISNMTNGEQIVLNITGKIQSFNTNGDVHIIYRDRNNTERLLVLHTQFTVTNSPNGTAKN